MKAWRVHEYGSLDGLHLDDIETPAAGPGEVLVRIRAIGLNSSELQIVTGVWEGPRKHPLRTLPHSPGTESAGEVVEIGAGVDSHRPGDRVLIHPWWTCGACEECLTGWENTCTAMIQFGRNVNGSYREYAAVPAPFALPLPDAIPFETIAALATAAGTAWHMLVRHAELRAGETVLVVGGSSGIGSAGIQVAQLAGARVIATAGGPAKLERLRELGVEHVIDHNAAPDFASLVRGLTAGRGVDVVFDARGGDTFNPALASLRPRGRLIMGGYMAGFEVPFDILETSRWELRIFGSARRGRDTARHVLEQVALGRLQPVLDSVVPFDELKSGLGRMQRRETFGKVVVTT